MQLWSGCRLYLLGLELCCYTELCNSLWVLQAHIIDVIRLLFASDHVREADLLAVAFWHVGHVHQLSRFMGKSACMSEAALPTTSHALHLNRPSAAAVTDWWHGPACVVVQQQNRTGWSLLEYLLICSVDISPMRQQQLYDVDLSLVGCKSQSRSPL